MQSTLERLRTLVSIDSVLPNEAKLSRYMQGLRKERGTRSWRSSRRAFGRAAASLMPRVRHRSKAVDIDHGQLVGRHLNRFAVVMSLDKLAPAAGRDRRAGPRTQTARWAVTALERMLAVN